MARGPGPGSRAIRVLLGYNCLRGSGVVKCPIAIAIAIAITIAIRGLVANVAVFTVASVAVFTVGIVAVVVIVVVVIDVGP